MKIPDSLSFFRGHQSPHVATRVGWGPGHLVQAEYVLPCCTCSTVSSQADSRASFTEERRGMCKAASHSVSTNLSRDFLQGADFRSACCLTQTLSLCVRECSLHIGQSSSAADLQTHFNTWGCLDCGKVLESVTGTHVTMKQVVYRLALGNSQCEVNASCRAVLLWLLNFPTLLHQSHQGGRARPDVGQL